MDLATFKLVTAVGALLNSALFLAGCFVAGILYRNPMAWRLALVAAGLTYLSHLCHVQHFPGDRLAVWGNMLTWVAIVVSIAAGLALLVL